MRSSGSGSATARPRDALELVVQKTSELAERPLQLLSEHHQRSEALDRLRVLRQPVTRTDPVSRTFRDGISARMSSMTEEWRWLPLEDSNLGSRIQSPRSYH